MCRATPTSVAAMRVRLGDFKRNSYEDGQYVEMNVTTIYRHTDFVPQGKNPAVHTYIHKLNVYVLKK